MCPEKILFNRIRKESGLKTPVWQKGDERTRNIRSLRNRSGPGICSTRKEWADQEYPFARKGMSGPGTPVWQKGIKGIFELGEQE